MLTQEWEKKLEMEHAEGQEAPGEPVPAEAVRKVAPIVTVLPLEKSAVANCFWYWCASCLKSSSFEAFHWQICAGLVLDSASPQARHLQSFPLQPILLKNSALELEEEAAAALALVVGKEPVKIPGVEHCRMVKRERQT